MLCVLVLAQQACLTCSAATAAILGVPYYPSRHCQKLSVCSCMHSLLHWYVSSVHLTMIAAMVHPQSQGPCLTTLCNSGLQHQDSCFDSAVHCSVKCSKSQLKFDLFAHDEPCSWQHQAVKTVSCVTSQYCIAVQVTFSASCYKHQLCSASTNCVVQGSAYLAQHMSKQTS